MKTNKKATVISFLAVNCSKEQPTQSINISSQIRPLLKLGKNLSVDEIASAEAMVVGGAIPDTLVFALTVDRANNMLKGILRLPEGVYSCAITIYIYDSFDRKIGQGGYSLTPTDFRVGVCVTPKIGIESAKPQIDTLYTDKQAINIGDTIYLHATASDSFGGKIEKYEWKFASNSWITVSRPDTLTTVSSLDYQTFACSLRVTDDESNTTTRGLSVTVIGIITDFEGNQYRTVKIGNQVWTVENLRTTKYNDGAAIPYGWGDSPTPAHCFYNNTTDADSIIKYGALYNWYVVNTGHLSPDGWRIPTEADWDSLEIYLISHGYGFDGTATDNRIAKALSAKIGWVASTSVAAIGNEPDKNNSSGFSAVPCGRSNTGGNFDEIGNSCFWWTSTDVDGSYAYSKGLYSDQATLLSYGWGSHAKTIGYSVRLVRNFSN